MTFIKAVLYIFLVVPALLRGVVGHVKVIERAPRPTQTSAPLNRVEKRQAAATPTTSYFTFNAPSIYQPPNSGDPSWLVVEVTDTDTFAETAGAMSAYCNVSIPGITFSNGPESWNIDWPKGSNIQACGALTFGIAISMEGANTVITLQHTITNPAVGTIVRTAKHAYPDYHTWTVLPLGGGVGLTTYGTFSEPYTQTPAPAGWVGDYLRLSTLAYVNSATYYPSSFAHPSKRDTNPSSMNFTERQAATGTALTYAVVSYQTLAPPVPTSDGALFVFSNPILHLPANSGNPSWFSIDFTDNDSFVGSVLGLTGHCNVSIPSIKFFNGSSPDWDVAWPAGSNIQVCGNPTMGIAIGLEGANVAVTLQHTVTGSNGQTDVRTAKHDFAAVHTWNYVENQYGAVLTLSEVYLGPWTAVPAPAGWVGDKLAS